MRRRLHAAFIASLLAIAAGAPTTNAASADQAASPACDNPIEGRTAGDRCVSSVEATVIDDAGAPIADLLVSVCAGTCFYGRTDADGAFSVRVGSYLPVDQYATLVHGRPDHAPYYVPLPSSSGDTFSYAAPLMVPRLPASGPAILTDGSAQTVAAGDATLHLAEGTAVEIHIEDRMLGAMGTQLRAVRIANPASLPFVDASAPPDLLYGFAPFEMRFSRKTAISFANTSRLPPGTAIEVHGMRGLVGGQPPAGRFVAAATAHVSPDGARIEMDPGEGVLSLTWLALRVK